MEIMKTVLHFLFIASALGSCSGTLFDRGGEKVDVTGDIPHDMIVLGDKLEDPYTVENMTKAVESLYPTRAGRVYLEPTDYYVRFLPRDDSDFDRLISAGVVPVDHPVDYEILRDGDWYHDPDLPEDEITWQYALVPADFVFPEGIAYEKLDECYLADHDPGTKADGIDWEGVEKAAYELTGNSSRLKSATKGDGSAKPEGRISIVDSSLDDEPVGVKGVMVLVHSFVKFSKTFTDDEGYYSINRKYSSEIRYRLVFKNEKGFAIGLNKILIPASTSTLGKHGPEGTSIVVDGNSEKKLFTRCAVNNAAYDYWEQCSAAKPAVKTPPSNLRIWLFQKLDRSSAIMMQQGALVDDSAIGDFLGEYSWLVRMFLPDVTIGVRYAGGFPEIYSTTVHELAHASHFMQVGKSWWSTLSEGIMKSFVTSGFNLYGSGTEDDHGYIELAEMWAYYVQTVMFRERYPFTDLVFGTEYWFHPQVFLYMDERGLVWNRIFPALTNDVCDREILEKKLTSLYPEFKSIIKQSFERYE